MAARLTKDAVIQASTLRIVCLLAIAAGLPTARTAAHAPTGEQRLDERESLRESEQQAWLLQQQRFHRMREQNPHAAPQIQSRVPGEPAERAPIASAGTLLSLEPISETESARSAAEPPPAVLWTFVAAGLMLLGLAAGAIGTWMVLQRRQIARATSDASFDSSAGQFESPTGEAASPFMTGLEMAWSDLKLRLGRGVRTAKTRLRRMVPSRQLVLRASCVLVGVALMLVSLVGFSTGEVLLPFIGLSIGYGIAVSVWLLPARSPGAAADNKPPTTTAPAGVPRAATPQPAVVRPEFTRRADHPAPPATLGSEAPPAAPEQLPMGDTESAPLPFAMGRATLLVCSPCGKQYSVRGEGEVALRLIPCPQCGSALALMGAEGIAPAIEADFAPIVSVACRQCRGIIDVPYASIGSSIDCPRCQAELPVPRLDDEPRLLPHRRHLIRA